MDAKKEKRAIPTDKVELYDRLIATNPNIERKGVGLPYTSANGNMFTFMSESGAVAIRLPKDAREAFLKKYDAKLMEAHGAIMKEYVEVPADLLKNTEALKRYLDMSYEYVKTLKPKAQKKSKPAGDKK